MQFKEALQRIYTILHHLTNISTTLGVGSSSSYKENNKNSLNTLNSTTPTTLEEILREESKLNVNTPSSDIYQIITFCLYNASRVAVLCKENKPQNFIIG